MNVIILGKKISKINWDEIVEAVKNLRVAK